MKRLIRCNTSGYTFEELAKVVSDSMIEEIDEGGYDTYKEMVEDYGWRRDDVQSDVDYTIRKYTDERAGMTDTNTVAIGNDKMSYTEFAKMWKDNLRKIGRL